VAAEGEHAEEEAGPWLEASSLVTCLKRLVQVGSCEPSGVGTLGNSLRAARPC
jgi:hypothetical protein